MKFTPLTTGILGFIVTFPAFWLFIPKAQQAAKIQEIQDKLPKVKPLPIAELPSEEDGLQILTDLYVDYRDAPEDQRQSLFTKATGRLHNTKLAYPVVEDQASQPNKKRMLITWALPLLWETAARQLDSDPKLAVKTLEFAVRLEDFGVNHSLLFRGPDSHAVDKYEGFITQLASKPRDKSTIELILEYHRKRPRPTLAEALRLEARIFLWWGQVENVDGFVNTAKNMLILANESNENYVETKQKFHQMVSNPPSFGLSTNSNLHNWDSAVLAETARVATLNILDMAISSGLDLAPKPDPFTLDSPLQVRKEDGTITIWSRGQDEFDNGGDPKKDAVLTVPVVEINEAMLQ